jgi:threonine synthase
MNRCEKCGAPLNVGYDLDKLREAQIKGNWISRAGGIWKYWELLPSSPDRAISLGEGNTRLHRAKKLGEDVGLKELLIKDETTNPTGSFLDRGASVLTTKLVEHGFKGIQGSFKGNLGASLAAYSARAGLECVIRLDEEVDLAKLYQMIAYGAEIILPNNELPSEPSDLMYMADNADPFLIEGHKTIAFEILQALGWKEPDCIVVPVGSGGLVWSLWKAFEELKWIGIIEDNRTRLVGVQSSACSPIADEILGWHRGRSMAKHHIAKDLVFQLPERRFEAIEAIKKSNGWAYVVSDEEMLMAARTLAKEEGIFAEPAAASTIACVRMMVEDGRLEPTDQVVCVITGSGLKDPIVAMKELERNIALERFIRGEVPRRPLIGKTKEKILKLLKEGPCHAYGIWSKLKDEGKEISPSAVYQHISKLEEEGLIAKTEEELVSGRTRIIYSLTEKGKKLADIL